ncbi:MAG: hypothetical protein ACYC6L_03630 [Anaerolineae bacterium]
MPTLFGSGRLTFPIMLLAQFNNLAALLTGSARDTRAMKQRVRGGYEGEYSPHVHQYDEFGYRLQDRSARFQLEGLDLRGVRCWMLAAARAR